MPPAVDHEPTRPGAERGAALVWALLFVVITSGMIVAHASHMAAVRRDLDARYDRRALADAMLRSGQVDVRSWFNAQTVQPVLAFAPRHDPFADPPALETLDPAVGLVREFEIRGNLWGRYEIRHEQVRDISAASGAQGPGQVWEVGVESSVYRVADPERPFDAAPNRVVARAATRTVMRGMTLALPALSAVSVQDPADVFVLSNAVVDGGSRPGLVHGDGPTRDPAATTDAIDPVKVADTPYATSPDATVDLAAQLLGAPASLRLVSMVIRPEDVFGMRTEELRRFADVIWTPGSERLPADVRGRFVLVPGNAVISGETIEGAALFVDGDLSVTAAAAPTRIVGVVFVTGTMKIDGNAEVRGALSVMGELWLGDGSSPPVTVEYDDAVVEKLRADLRRYRLRRGALPSDG